MRARLRAKRERTRWLGWVTRSEKAEAVASRRHGGPPATGGPVTDQREKEREREREEDQGRRWRTQHRAVVVAGSGFFAGYRGGGRSMST